MNNVEVIRIKKSRIGINRYGARKYSEVKGSEGNLYSVVKYRKKGTRNYLYSCTCPDFIYRRTTCKHIKAFKEAEKYCSGTYV